MERQNEIAAINVILIFIAGISTQQAMTSAAGELPIFDARLQRNPGRVAAMRR